MNISNTFFSIRNLLLASILCTVAVSCNEDDNNEVIPEPDTIATVLDCNYFHESRTLVDDPSKPVDYVVTCQMVVKGDLTIEPGVVIAFEQNAGIELNDFNDTPSNMVAVGTAENQIVFTGTVEQKGYWSGIFINSSDPRITLKYVNIEYAGGEKFNSNNDRGAVIVYADAKLTMTNCIISNSATAGLNAVYGGSTIQLGNNKFKENAVPLLIYDIYAGVPSLTDDYSGNDLNRVILRGYTAAINDPLLWKNINVPYRVENGEIDIRNLVTIEPGTVIEMGPGTSMRIHEDGGGLKMVGTQLEPIIIRGEFATAGSWESIYFTGNHSSNEIAYAEISHAGENPVDNPGAIRLWINARLNIHDVTFNNLSSAVCSIVYRLLPSQTDNPNLIVKNIMLNDAYCIKQVWE